VPYFSKFYFLVLKKRKRKVIAKERGAGEYRAEERVSTQASAQGDHENEKKKHNGFA
jgi:hypothetical protein